MIGELVSLGHSLFRDVAVGGRGNISASVSVVHGEKCFSQVW